MIELIQTILLIILVDRTLILRSRYKFAIENSPPNKYGAGYWALWIYHKPKDGESYWRDGGRRLIYFKYGKRKL